jgi:serine/threonine-protein kinase
MSDAATTGSKAAAATPGRAAGAAGRIDTQKTVISKRPPVSPPSFRRAASPFEMGEALEGEQLGHFQLEEFVGGGGMGAVFRATDTMLGRTVAVKVVSRDQTNEETLRRFKNEAQSAARLDHPNIARVYYVGEDQGWHYIVFEYIEGINVRDLVDHNGPLALEDAIGYTLQIAEALEHAAHRDVTHRDIKPSNILIMIDGKAKLVDMGLARLQQMESSTDDLTASGVTLGTFDYISPEQARDPRNTDVRSDLYSLGCTLFFMLTGQPPFPEGTVLQKLLSHSSDAPPDLLEYRPDLDEQVAAIIHKLLAKQPDQRFQTPRALIGELLLVADRLELTGIQAHSTIWFTHNNQQPAWWVRHLPWMSTVALLPILVSTFALITSPDTLPLPNPKYPASVPEAVLPKTIPELRGDEQELGNEVPAPKFSEPDSQGGLTTQESTEAAVNGNAAGPLQEPATTEQSPVDATADAGDSAIRPPNEDENIATPQADQQRRDRRSPATQNGGAGSAESSNVPPASAPQQDESLIVVADPLTEVPEGALVAASLQEALDQAQLQNQPPVIELAFDELRVLDPILIDAEKIPQQRLVIRAAAGAAPVLAFRCALDNSRSAGRRAMIRILGGNVVWENVHFYLELPESSTWQERRSLFELDSTDRTEFRDCTFTIRNVDSESPPEKRIVSFVSIVGPGGGIPGPTGLGSVLADSLPFAANEAPTLWLRDCIARGQAPFVRADYAVPFLFSWDHGLFISSERLVEVGGTRFQPSWEHGVVNVLLDRLLCVADKGICLVRSDQLAPYQLRVTTQADNCLFATKATTPPVPLYVVRTGSDFGLNTQPITINGSRNYYRNTHVVLRMENNGDGTSNEQYDFDELTLPDAPSWYNEENPEPTKNVLLWERPSRSVDRQTLHDFIPPTVFGDDWFTRVLAIWPADLPRLPEIDPLLEQADSPTALESGAAADDPPPKPSMNWDSSAEYR